jgi:hypothetical protein
MEDNNASEKLQKNTARVTALSALRKIRSLVDRQDEHDRNKKRLIIIYILLIVLTLSAFYFFINDKPDYLRIKTNHAVPLK